MTPARAALIERLERRGAESGWGFVTQAIRTGADEWQATTHPDPDCAAAAVEMRAMEGEIERLRHPPVSQSRPRPTYDPQPGDTEQDLQTYFHDLVDWYDDRVATLNAEIERLRGYTDDMQQTLNGLIAQKVHDDAVWGARIDDLEREIAALRVGRELP